MAGSSPVDNLLDTLTHSIKDLTVQAGDMTALKIINKFDKKKVHGVGLEANRKFRTGRAGKIARASAGGALAVGLAPTAIAGKYGVKKMTLGFEWNDEDLKKMASGRAGLHTTMGKEIELGLEKFKRHQERLFFGDGSGVVCRIEGDPGTNAYFSFGPGPCLAIEDDEIEAVLDRSTTLDTGGEKDGGDALAAVRRVVQIDHSGKVVYLDAAIDTLVADNECYALSNGIITQSDDALKFTAYPMGLMGHLTVGTGDDTTAGNSIWDTGAASEYYCVEKYNNLTRTTAANRKMLAQHKAAGSAPISPYYLSYGPSQLHSQGVPEKKMLLLMSTKEYNRIVEMYSGSLIAMRSGNIKLPGGKLKLPVVTAGGQADVPIMASPYMLDGAIATLKLGEFEQIYADGGWVDGGAGGGRLHLRPTASAATFDHVFQAFMVTYWNNTCLNPSSQHLLSGLDTSDG